MAEKKAATKKAAAPKAACAKKATATKSCAAKKATAVKEPAFYIDSQSVGFRAGDVYQALATAQKALSVAEIAAAANITESEALLGIGWLFKELKVKDAEGKIVLA